MVVPSNAIPVQELRTADGQVFALLVTPEEFARMQAELQALRERTATLQRQKNHYVNELLNILKTWMPIPPTEEEVLAAVPNGDELRKIIAEIEAS